MPNPITCHLNAGMERLLTFRENGHPHDISGDNRFSIFFDVVYSPTGNEQRYIRVIDNSTGIEKFKVRLNPRGGAKPLNGDTGMYEPDRRPNHRSPYRVNIETHRVFLAEINLSADPDIELYLRIDPKNNLEDQRRYLSFIKTGVTALEEDFQNIPLEDGKKPLGGE
jgi:hypothetical protein